MKPTDKENLVKRGRSLRAIAAVTALVALSGTTFITSAAENKRPPNILFIMADDLGYGGLSCYGATRIKTANIDRLAREGCRFTDAHTPSSCCSPTRYGVLTGRYSFRSRLTRLVCMPNDPLLIDLGRMTVASLLKSAGYATGCVGKWHLGFGAIPKDARSARMSFGPTPKGSDWTPGGPNWNGELRPGPLEIGFDYYFGVPTSNNWPPYVFVENHRVVDRRDDETIEVISGPQWKTGEPRGIAASRKDEQIGTIQTAKAVRFIERSKDKPFFLYFPICNIHLPHTPAARFCGTSQCGIYGDFIHELDWSVGQMLQTLERLNLADSTLVIFTSDNGARERWGRKSGHRSCGALRGGKSSIWEGGHRVPFVARWPGHIKPGSQCNETICLTDLLATAAAIVGVALPEEAGSDSYNILPALLGEKLLKPIREATVHHSCGGQFAIRQGPWKLIMPGNLNHRDNLLAAITKNKLGKRQLYNLNEDPAEKTDISQRHPEIVERLTSLLAKYVRQGRSRR